MCEIFIKEDDKQNHLTFLRYMFDIPSLVQKAASMRRLSLKGLAHCLSLTDRFTDLCFDRDVDLVSSPVSHTS